jgi:hypothetical protein
MRLFSRKTAQSSRGHKGCFCAVRLLGAGKTILFEGPLDRLRFSEKLIRAKSVYFFHDPEPCFIHRGAVAARLFGELNLLFEGTKKISAAELEKNYPGYLDEYPGTEFIESVEET